MFAFKALLSLVLISLSAVDARPLSRSTGKTTLSFVTKIDGGATLNVIEKDRARVKALKDVGHLDKRSTSFSVTNAAVIYTTSVGVGSPATDYTLVIDTGSSNTWIGASKPYTKTCTSKDTGNTVSESYGSGYFSGEEYIDTVTLASGLVITDQSIGVANLAIGFSGVDGILGIGPTDLTFNKVNNTNTVPTVSDNLLSQGMISEEVLGIYYVPASESSSTGEITFGGYDDSVITDSVSYVSLTTSPRASYYWGVDQSISYGGTTILSTTSGIVDTGTTFILIATDAFQKYQSATGGIMDSATGLLRISTSQYSKLKTLSFNIGGKSYDFSPNAQIWPRSLNSALNGSSRSIYLVVGDLDTNSTGPGFDFVNGYAFLERYYSVFDTTNRRMGFAPTLYTNANTN